MVCYSMTTLKGRVIFLFFVLVLVTALLTLVMWLQPTLTNNYSFQSFRDNLGKY